MRRQSEIEFVRQMGFEAVDPDHQLYVALMFQPRTIAGLFAVGVVLQSAWLFLGLSAMLWWATVVPSRNPFDAAYNRLIAFPRGLPPIPQSPPPRRFAQAMAGTVAFVIGAALLAGASLVAWVFQGLFAMALTSVIAGRLCAPASLYLRFTPAANRASSVARRA